MTDVELAIPPRAEYVGVVRLAIAALARAAGADEDRVDDLKIAVSEACTNAVLSHADAVVDGPISITWREEPERAVVEVLDSGAVYDPDTRGDEGPGMRLALSVALLRSLVDCEIAPRPEGGGMSARLSIAL